MPFVNQSKSDTAPVWKRYTRRGTSPTLGELGDFVFTDPISEDGDPTMDAATLGSLDSSSQVLVNNPKS